MTQRFKVKGNRIAVTLSGDERLFLSEVLALLDSVGREGDPAGSRLRVPVYLDDPKADTEWWRLMSDELDAARKADREIFKSVLDSIGNPIDVPSAEAFLRVLNEGRLVLGARLGVEVAADYERLSDQDEAAMGFLGWLLEELTEELMLFL